ncbi:MAG: hypothetical protein U1F87_15855 [Kiritimatiellia bacterium]
MTNTKRARSVPLPPENRSDGCREQVRSIDYRARGMKKIGRAPDELLEEVLAVIDACLFPRTTPGGGAT